jgi:hypothetical protein
MLNDDLVDTWRRIILGEDKSWVLFAHGTCVMLPEPDDTVDLASRAVDILREYGPVQAGSSAGDFGTIVLDPGPGWAVYGHHSDVLTYVGPQEVSTTTDLAVGLHGRNKRDLDGRDLQIIHVEDRRR